MPCNTCAQISVSKPLPIIELRAILHVTYQDMSRKLHNEDAMSKVGLMKAAELTGKSASTIHRAMKAGRLSFNMNEHGERVVDASELFRVFPPKATLRNCVMKCRAMLHDITRNLQKRRWNCAPSAKKMQCWSNCLMKCARSVRPNAERKSDYSAFSKNRHSFYQNPRKKPHRRSQQGGGGTCRSAEK